MPQEFGTLFVLRMEGETMDLDEEFRLRTSGWKDGYVAHGPHWWPTPYKGVQHKYAGGDEGFIELLEIFDPPKDKSGFVILWHDMGKSKVISWKSLEDAQKGWTHIMAARMAFCSALPGFVSMEDSEDGYTWFFPKVTSVTETACVVL